MNDAICDNKLQLRNMNAEKRQIQGDELGDTGTHEEMNSSLQKGQLFNINYIICDVHILVSDECSLLLLYLGINSRTG